MAHFACVGCVAIELSHESKGEHASEEAAQIAALTAAAVVHAFGSELVLLNLCQNHGAQFSRLVQRVKNVESVLDRAGVLRGADRDPDLWDALKAHGMFERVCKCGRPFLTREDSALCPPCRGLGRG